MLSMRFRHGHNAHLVFFSELLRSYFITSVFAHKQHKSEYNRTYAVAAHCYNYYTIHFSYVKGLLYKSQASKTHFLMI